MQYALGTIKYLNVDTTKAHASVHNECAKSISFIYKVVRNISQITKLIRNQESNFRILTATTKISPSAQNIREIKV